MSEKQKMVIVVTPGFQDQRGSIATLWRTAMSPDPVTERTEAKRDFAQAVKPERLRNRLNKLMDEFLGE